MATRLQIALALLLVALSPAPAGAAPETALVIPTGIPIQLDGHLAPAEWSDALDLPFVDHNARLRVKQLAGTLLLSFEAAEHWVENAELILYFVPDDVRTDIGAWSDRAFTLRYDPLDHNRPHLLITRQDGKSTSRVQGEVVAAAALGGSYAAAELALPLTSLGIKDGEVVRMAALWIRPGAVGQTATIPVGLDVRANPNEPPPDLAHSGRWTRLGGVERVGGPGAFSPARWEGWVAAHDEIARRGEAAYALYREMDEERRIFKKQDGLVNETIVDALRYIAERETLTDEDRLLMARAYAQTNRGEQAIAIFDGLVGSRRSGLGRRALYDRAKTLRTLERFEEEARTWEHLAELAGPALKDRYRFAASTARELIEPWTLEQRARAEDDAKELPLVELRTNRGRVLLELYPDDVPKAVAHFLALVRSGFYDGLRFHRVIGEFTAQTGDPKTRNGDCSHAGSGSSEARIEIEENKRHGFWRGAVGFAVGMVQENGSQFFILTGPKPELGEEAFTCFARVVSGMDVVDRIEWCDTLLSARVLRQE